MSKYQAYPKYKDSGVEWLGAIPEEWGSKPLKYLCSYNDSVLDENSSKDMDIQYIDIGSVSSTNGITHIEIMKFGDAPSRARRVVRDGDVIVSTVRTYLEAIAPINNPPENLIVSTGFAVIRPNKKRLFKGYAAYCLRAQGFIKEVVARSVGVSYPAINSSDLVNIKIPNLSYSEQIAIANFLDQETAKIDQLIEKQQQLIELLKEKRQAVISHAVTKGLDPNVPMKDSGVEWLGEIPEGWEKILFKRVVLQVKDGTHGTHERVDDGHYLLSAKNVFNHGLVVGSSESMIPEKDYRQIISNGFPTLGDILVTCVGTIGRSCIFPYEKPIAFQRSVAFLRLNTSSNSKYYKYFIESKEYQSQLESLVKSSAQGGVYMGDLIGTVVVKCSLSEQQKIVNFLDQETAKIDTLITKAQSAITLMQERRTGLISAAVTGKIDVRNWQAPHSTLVPTEVSV